MYFITVDGSEITALYDGSKDYVHRVTGEAIAGAVTIPDTAIKITQDEADMIKLHGACCSLEWNGTNVINTSVAELDHKKAKLLYFDTGVYKASRKDEVDLLTEAEVDTALAAYGVE